MNCRHASNCFRSFLAMLIVACFATSARSADANQLTEQEIADGWILLFDGESLFGWQPQSNADWKAEGGVIRVSSGEPGLLTTNTEFADYELRADFRSPKETNSGIFLRTQPKPKTPKEGCYELNIAPFGSSPYATGSLVARGETAKAPAGYDGDGKTWHTFAVRCDGTSITVSIDGKQVVAYKETLDANPTRRGHIGLQLNSGEVEFRNLKLKPLGQKPLFNGKDLAGWHTHPDLKNAFSVDKDGVLQLTGGKSQLESETKFGDFTLQLAARANKPRSNSGVFFRSIPSEVMNGYECQLQNCYGADGKPNPVDCGTGGICRRQTARKLVAKDGDWLRLTLIATGPHMAAWVNGYQVSDFTDTRKPNANPRNGLRTDAGTLILQGHDDSTNFSFRDINAAEMAK